MPSELFKAPRVRCEVGRWTVVLDTYSVGENSDHMRLRAPFLNPGGFRFQIYRRSIISDLLKKLGMPDIEVGDPAFDEEFIVQSNDEATVRELLANPMIRWMIQTLPLELFEIRDNDGCFGTKFPDDIDELDFLTPGVIENVAILKRLFELFTILLEQLCRIRVTTRRRPGVSL